MAPVLVCPECGTKHPLNSVGPRTAFPCSGCGRTLKVPARATAATTPAWPPAPGAADRDPHATQMISTTAPPVASATAVAPPLSPPISAADLPSAPIPAPLSQNGTVSGPVPGPPPGLPSGIMPPRAGAPVPPGPDFVPARVIRFLLWVVAVPLAFFVVFGLARLFGFLSTNDVTDVALAEGFSRFWPVVRLLPFVALATAGLVHGGVFAIAQIRARRHSSPSAGKPPAGSPRPERPRRGQSSRPGA